MSRNGNEAPRQDSAAFAANDRVAQQEGAARGGTTARTECPPLWKLRVDVRAEADARRTRIGAARTQLVWSRGPGEDRACEALDDLRARGAPITGRGPFSVTCSASATGWYTETPVVQALADGDDRVVEVVLKPLPWVAFQAKESPADTGIAGLQVQARIPEIGAAAQAARTPDGGLLTLEPAELRPGMHLELLSLGDDAVVWEVVGDLASG